MAPYIGTATSRVDGLAKVTGAAKYAADHNVAGLAHGSVVCSTIAKGRITRLDTAAAMAVRGVLAVLTHDNRPPLPDNDQAYKDEVAPAGSPFRPLYDDRILFNGQPIALVAAETPEIARFAASLVGWNTIARSTSPTCTAGAIGPYRHRRRPTDGGRLPAAQAARHADQALAAAAVRHEAEYHVPIEHHNPMELYASTVIVEGNGKLTVTTRPRACRTCTSMCAAYSACSRRMCASCRRSWAAGSARDCARSTRWCWRSSRRARCNARCASC
jgi:xanthine dehydrogenase YagR molybdenum-binding subunit